MSPNLTLPTLAQIEALLVFLPTFGKATKKHATFQLPEHAMPWWKMSPAADAFYLAIYENGFVQVFSWFRWQQEGFRFIKSRKKVAQADLETICRLLTLHVRRDRFCDGHFAAQLENGHMAAILHRLAHIAEDMRNQAAPPSTPEAE